jgi:hypothetical protein
MNLRMLAAIGSLGLGAAGTLYAPPAQARGYVAVEIGVPPPPPRHETIVVREGYVWAPGYWRWHRHRYAWAEGYWLRERPGYVWVGPRWAPRGSHWHFNHGYWERR